MLRTGSGSRANEGDATGRPQASPHWALLEFIAGPSNRQAAALWREHKFRNEGGDSFYMGLLRLLSLLPTLDRLQPLVSPSPVLSLALYLHTTAMR